MALTRAPEAGGVANAELNVEAPATPEWIEAQAAFDRARLAFRSAAEAFAADRIDSIAFQKAREARNAALVTFEAAYDAAIRSTRN